MNDPSRADAAARNELDRKSCREVQKYMKPKKNRRTERTKIRYSFLRIMTGSDLSRRRLPFMAAESSNPGPVVWLTACGHGDEVAGIVIIQDIFKRMRKQNLLKGSLYSFPLMNPIGFETISRHITFSEEDLNRSFPGGKDGSLGERIAHKIFTSIIQTNPTLVLDLHSDWMKSIPYTLIDPDRGIGQTEAYQKTKMLANRAGFVVICDTEGSGKTLSDSLMRRGIPALTLELGESFVVNEKNIENGVRSIWSILSYLEMTKPMEEPAGYTLPELLTGNVLRYCDKPFSSTSGIIRFLAAPGDFVKKGQPIAKTYNAFGKLQETLTALDDSIVLGHADSSVVFPGMRVMAFGMTAGFETKTEPSNNQPDQRGTTTRDDL